MSLPGRAGQRISETRSCTFSTTVPTASFTATAASPACSSTAAPTRFTRSTGDCFRLRLPLFRPPLLLRDDDEPLLAERPLVADRDPLLLDRDRDPLLVEREPLLAERDVPLVERDPLLADRVVGRFADDALRAPARFALEREEPRAVGRFDPERFRAPPFLLPPRRALDPERFPRDDLALVAMVFVLD